MSRRVVFKTAPQHPRPDDPILPETAIYQAKTRRGYIRPKGRRGKKPKGKRKKTIHPEEILRIHQQSQINKERDLREIALEQSKKRLELEEARMAREEGRAGERVLIDRANLAREARMARETREFYRGIGEVAARIAAGYGGGGGAGRGDIAIGGGVFGREVVRGARVPQALHDQLMEELEGRHGEELEDMMRQQRERFDEEAERAAEAGRASDAEIGALRAEMGRLHARTLEQAAELEAERAARGERETELAQEIIRLTPRPQAEQQADRPLRLSPEPPVVTPAVVEPTGEGVFGLEEEDWTTQGQRRQQRADDWEAEVRRTGFLPAEGTAGLGGISDYIRRGRQEIMDTGQTRLPSTREQVRADESRTGTHRSQVRFRPESPVREVEGMRLELDPYTPSGTTSEAWERYNQRARALLIEGGYNPEEHSDFLDAQRRDILGGESGESISRYIRGLPSPLRKRSPTPEVWSSRRRLSRELEESVEVEPGGARPEPEPEVEPEGTTLPIPSAIAHWTNLTDTDIRRWMEENPHWRPPEQPISSRRTKPSSPRITLGHRKVSESPRPKTAARGISRPEGFTPELPVEDPAKREERERLAKGSGRRYEDLPDWYKYGGERVREETRVRPSPRAAEPETEPFIRGEPEWERPRPQVPPERQPRGYGWGNIVRHKKTGRLGWVRPTHGAVGGLHQDFELSFFKQTGGIPLPSANEQQPFGDEEEDQLREVKKRLRTKYGYGDLKREKHWQSARPGSELTSLDVIRAKLEKSDPPLLKEFDRLRVLEEEAQEDITRARGSTAEAVEEADLTPRERLELLRAAGRQSNTIIRTSLGGERDLYKATDAFEGKRLWVSGDFGRKGLRGFTSFRSAVKRHGAPVEEERGFIHSYEPAVDRWVIQREKGHEGTSADVSGRSTIGHKGLMKLLDDETLVVERELQAIEEEEEEPVSRAVSAPADDEGVVRVGYIDPAIESGRRRREEEGGDVRFRV